MYAYSVFRRQSAQSTRLMAPSEQAKGVGIGPRSAKPKEEVMTEARNFIANNGGDPNDSFLTLAHCQLQFGMYQGQRFRWLMENNLGFALYLLELLQLRIHLRTPGPKVRPNCRFSVLLRMMMIRVFSKQGNRGAAPRYSRRAPSYRNAD
ncbi:unnamed protein product [Gadus morhua 'NCC']